LFNMNYMYYSKILGITSQKTSIFTNKAVKISKTRRD